MLARVGYIILSLSVFIILNLAREFDLLLTVILGCIGLSAYVTFRLVVCNHGHLNSKIITVIIFFLLIVLCSMAQALIDRSGGQTAIGFLLFSACIFCLQAIRPTHKHFAYVVLFCVLTLALQGSACLWQALNPNLFQKAGWIDYGLSTSPELNRSYGLLKPENPLAFAMFILPLVTVVNIYLAREFQAVKRSALGILAVGLSAGVYSLLASGSRGPMVGFLAVFFLIVGYLVYRKEYDALFAHLFCLICAVAVNSSAGHWRLWSTRVFNMTEDTSINTRFIVWRLMFEHFGDVPMWGVGPGITNSSFFIQKYLPAHQTILTTYNVFIEHYLCLGGAGLACFILILTMSFRNAWREVKSKDSTAHLCCAAAVFAMMIAGMFESFIHQTQAQIMLSILVAFALSNSEPRVVRE